MLKVFAFALAMVLPLPATAGDITVSNVKAKLGDVANSHHIQIVMEIMNAGAAPDRLYAARSSIAPKIRLATVKDKSFQSHGHSSEMHMTSTSFIVPAGGRLSLKHQGNHLMANDLKGAPKPGSTFKLTLFFEKAGKVETTVMVENHG